MAQTVVSTFVGLLGIAVGWFGGTALERRRTLSAQRETAFSMLIGAVAKSSAGGNGIVEAAQAKALLLVCCDERTADLLRVVDAAAFRGDDPDVPEAMAGIVNNLRASLRLPPLGQQVVMDLLYGA